MSIFESEAEEIYLGNLFLSDYYVVFDMTPFSERDEKYIQIGIGKQSKTNLI
jgi:hypothetical protein